MARVPRVLDVRTKLERRRILSSTFKKPASGEVGERTLRGNVRAPGRESPAPLDRSGASLVVAGVEVASCSVVYKGPRRKW